MENEKINLRERKLIAVTVIVFGVLLLLYNGFQSAYLLKYLFETLEFSQAYIAFWVINKSLVFLVGLVFLLVAKTRKMHQTAWEIAIFSVILLIGLYSFYTLVVVAVALLFVGVVLQDKIPKLAAGLLVVLETVFTALEYFGGEGYRSLMLKLTMSGLINFQSVIAGFIFVVVGITLLCTRASFTRKSEPRNLTNSSVNGMKSTGITIIYTAIYLLCEFGVYWLLLIFVFNRPINADLVSTYAFFEALYKILLPVGLLPLTYVLSKKYRPVDDNKWLRIYEFLIGLLYISSLGFIIENLGNGYFGYFSLSVFLLLCVVCALVLILKEKKPNLSLAVLAIAILHHLILLFIAAVLSLITGYEIVTYLYDITNLDTILMISISAFALVLYLVLGIVLLYRSKKLKPESVD